MLFLEKKENAGYWSQILSIFSVTNRETGNYIYQKYVLKVDQYRLMVPRALNWILLLEKTDPLKKYLKQIKKQFQ